MVLSAGASGAEAAKQPKEADLGAKRSVAPDAALGGTLAAKKKEEGPAGPALTFETFRRGIEVSISSKRREEIAGLQKLIWEESQYYFFEANRRDDLRIELGTRGDPREIDRLTAEKKGLEGEQAKL